MSKMYQGNLDGHDPVRRKVVLGIAGSVASAAGIAAVVKYGPEIKKLFNSYIESVYRDWEIKTDPEKRVLDGEEYMCFTKTGEPVCYHMIKERALRVDGYGDLIPGPMRKTENRHMHWAAFLRAASKYNMKYHGVSGPSPRDGDIVYVPDERIMGERLEEILKNR